MKLTSKEAQEANQALLRAQIAARALLAAERCRREGWRAWQSRFSEGRWIVAQSGIKYEFSAEEIIEFAGLTEVKP